MFDPAPVAEAGAEVRELRRVGRGVRGPVRRGHVERLAESPAVDHAVVRRVAETGTACGPTSVPERVPLVELGLFPQEVEKSEEADGSSGGARLACGRTAGGGLPARWCRPCRQGQGEADGGSGLVVVDGLVGVVGSAGQAWWDLVEGAVWRVLFALARPAGEVVAAGSGADHEPEAVGAAEAFGVPNLGLGPAEQPGVPFGGVPYRRQGERAVGESDVRRTQQVLLAVRLRALSFEAAGAPGRRGAFRDVRRRGAGCARRLFAVRACGGRAATARGPSRWRGR